MILVFMSKYKYMIFFDFCTIYFHYICQIEYNKMNYDYIWV